MLSENYVPFSQSGKYIPTTTRPLTPGIVSSEGTIRRCEHGVYQAKGDQNHKAAYCQMCTPGGPSNQRKVMLPRFTGDPLDENGRTYANKHSGTGCPACGSQCWLHAGAKRECADCGQLYVIRVRAA